MRYLDRSNRIWSLSSQKSLAIIALTIIYWLAEPIDYGSTALIGCNPL